MNAMRLEREYVYHRFYLRIAKFYDSGATNDPAACISALGSSYAELPMSVIDMLLAMFLHHNSTRMAFRKTLACTLGAPEYVAWEREGRD
jgi:hypothetical protein